MTRSAASWREVGFDEAFQRLKLKAFEIPTKDYQVTGTYPIIDQGDGDVAGYIDREDPISDVPFIVFGDHTTIVKYVDQPCFIGSQGVVPLKARECYDPYFLYLMLGRTRIPALGYSRHFRELENKTFPLPPLAEQRKIAEILRTWDEAIETAEAELKAKQERKRWLMTIVMQKSYETKSISQFGTLKKGGTILREKLRSKGVPVVLYGDIYTKYSEIVTRLISRVDASAVVDGVKLNSGDIVFAGSGETAEEIGKCIAYVGEETAYAGGDVVILCNHGQDPRYLGYALNSEDAIRQKMRLGQGSSVMHLYKDDVASIKIPLPPISDQRKVGEILSEADADIELINQRINVLHDQKRGLMQKLLTGEVRVAA